MTKLTPHHLAGFDGELVDEKMGELFNNNAGGG